MEKLLGGVTLRQGLAPGVQSLWHGGGGTPVPGALLRGLGAFGLTGRQLGRAPPCSWLGEAAGGGSGKVAVPDSGAELPRAIHPCH